MWKTDTKQTFCHKTIIGSVNTHKYLNDCERIQSSDAPIGHTHHQENKGDERVEQRRHHVTDSPVKESDIVTGRVLKS